MQAFNFLSRFKIVSVLTLLLTAGFCNPTQAQLFHAGGVAKSVFMEVAGVRTNHVHVGDTVTAIIVITNIDDFWDTFTVTQVGDVVFHNPNPPYSHAPETNILLSTPLTLVSAFDAFADVITDTSGVTFTHTYQVLPGDDLLPGGMLTDFAFAVGTDNHDGGVAGQVVDPNAPPDNHPLDFFLSKPGEIAVLQITNPPCVTASLATNRDITTCVLGAFSDLSYQDSGKPPDRNQALWMKGISTNLFFTNFCAHTLRPGTWFEDSATGTAFLSGFAVTITNDCAKYPTNSGFYVQLNLSGYTTTAPSPGANLTTKTLSKGIDPTKWHFYPVVTGKLTGFGSWQGAILNLTPKSGASAFQVGTGANLKNGNFGASGWFMWSNDPSATLKLSSGSDPQQADFNLDIICCP